MRIWDCRLEVEKLPGEKYRVTLTGTTSGEVRTAVSGNWLWTLLRLLGGHKPERMG